MIKNNKTFIALTIIIFLIPFFSCKKKKSELKFPHIPAIYGSNLSKVFAFSKDDILLVGSFGYVARTSKGSEIRFGNSKKHFWEVQDTGLSEALLTDASFPDSQHGWAVGITGIIIHTADGGKTWKRQESGTENHLFTVYFADTQNGWAAGDLMTLIHTADGGKTWESQEVEEILEENIFAAEVIYNGLYFHDAYEGWMVGEFGTIYHTTDGGKNWKHQDCDLLQPDVGGDEWELPRLTIYDIYFTDRNRGFILGVDGTLLKTEDGGKEWKKIDSATEQSLYSISVVGNKCWAVGNRGTYILSADGGNTWSVDKTAITTKGFLTSVDFSDEMTGWVVGKSGAVFKTVDGGKSWDWLSGISYEWPEFEPPKALVGD